MKSKRYSLIVICLLLWFGGAIGAKAQTTPSEGDGEGLSIQISQESASLLAGDWIEFNTILRNDGATATPPLVAHLNIAAVAQGPYVDPEDWSSQRTQYLSPLAPGESVELNWQLHTLVKGEFAFFVTVVSPDKVFSPVVSPSLLAQVAPDNILPLNEVIPVVAVVPLFPLALLLFSTSRGWRQRSQSKAVTKKSSSSLANL